MLRNTTKRHSRPDNCREESPDRMKNYLYEDGLTTERLCTRFLAPDDIKAWSKFFEDRDAIEFIPSHGLNSSEERAKFWIERQVKRYEHKRFGLQALIHIQTREFIGQCGLLLQEVDGKKELEVGYYIFKKYWGQGYATEAAQRFKTYAFKNKLADSVISIIDTGNVRSQKVAEKNGMSRGVQTKWQNIDAFIYRTK